MARKDRGSARMLAWLCVLAGGALSLGCMGISSGPGDGGGLDVRDRDVAYDVPNVPDIDPGDGNGGSGPGSGNNGPGTHDAVGDGFGFPSVDPDGGMSFPVCRESLRETFSTSKINNPERDSDAYASPDRAAIDSLQKSINRAFQADPKGSVKHAESAGYRVCIFGTGPHPVLIWKPEDDSTGHARLAVRSSPDAVPLIVEAPHAFFELHTLDEAVAIFEKARSRALISSGTHRCANTKPSNCDGRTRVCSSQPIAYRTSDMAHNIETFFHAMHVAVSLWDSRSVAVSLHGFTEEGISLSNGTTKSAARDSLVARVGSALESVFPSEKITYCNDIPGRPHEKRLCGTTNVQGRHYNGSWNACGVGADEASGRFLHIEQSLSIRENYQTVASAFASGLAQD